jgi:sigma-B regulation protein RsbU (phosphoserine phosphatase)
LRITQELNEFLAAYFSDTGLFVTFFALSIDLRTLDVEYCGAGHPGPLLWRRDGGGIDTLPSQNLPVGICDDFLRFPASGRTKISAGDRILLYTDGVTEIMGAGDVPLRASGLEEFLILGSTVPLFDLGDFLLQRLKEFGVGRPHDDMTLLMIEIPSPP